MSSDANKNYYVLKGMKNGDNFHSVSDSVPGAL